MKVNYKKWARACQAFTAAGFKVGGTFVRDCVVLQIAKANGPWLDVTLTDFSLETVQRAVEEMRRDYDEHIRAAEAFQRPA